MNSQYCVELKNHRESLYVHRKLKELYKLITENNDLHDRFILSYSGYSIGDSNWSFIEKNYPDLENFRIKYHLEKCILYLSTPTECPHNHIRPWASSLCFPIIGANEKTFTYWVEPTEELSENNCFYKHEVPQSEDHADSNHYDTFDKIPREDTDNQRKTHPYRNYIGEYKVLRKLCIKDYPVIFDGNQWHYVISQVENFDRHSRRCVNWGANLHWDEFVNLFTIP